MSTKKESFVCLSLSRSDFYALGFNASKISDEQMQQFANEIGESCTGESGTFWEVLETIANKERLQEIENEQIQ